MSADIQYLSVSNQVYFLSNNVGIHFVFTYQVLFDCCPCLVAIHLKPDVESGTPERQTYLICKDCPDLLVEIFLVLKAKLVFIFNVQSHCNVLQFCMPYLTTYHKKRVLCENVFSIIYVSLSEISFNLSQLDYSLLSKCILNLKIDISFLYELILC